MNKARVSIAAVLAIVAVAVMLQRQYVFVALLIIMAIAVLGSVIYLILSGLVTTLIIVSSMYLHLTFLQEYAFLPSLALSVPLAALVMLFLRHLDIKQSEAYEVSQNGKIEQYLHSIGVSYSIKRAPAQNPTVLPDQAFILTLARNGRKNLSLRCPYPLHGKRAPGLYVSMYFIQTTAPPKAYGKMAKAEYEEVSSFFSREELLKLHFVVRPVSHIPRIPEDPISAQNQINSVDERNKERWRDIRLKQEERKANYMRMNWATAQFFQGQRWRRP